MLCQEKAGLSCLRHSTAPGGELLVPVVHERFGRKKDKEFQQCCFSSLSSRLCIASVPRAAHCHQDKSEGAHACSSAWPAISHCSGVGHLRAWRHKRLPHPQHDAGGEQCTAVLGILPLTAFEQGSRSRCRRLNTNNRLIPAACLLETED